VNNFTIVVSALCASLCMPANAAGFSWVGSANTSTLRVNELADSLSCGITEKCARTYSDQQYLFYFMATDYLDRRDGTYVYSVGVSLFRKAQQWSAAPVSSYSVSGFRPGAPALIQRQQLLLEAARATASELCHQLETAR
jgi:hypothetical protein